MSVLVFNAGSSTLKFGLFDGTSREALADGLVDWRGGKKAAAASIRTRSGNALHSQIQAPTYQVAVSEILCSLCKLNLVANGFEDIQVVGHRVVHGGAEFRESVLITGSIKSVLANLSALAPLHNPPALETIEAAESMLPKIAQAAVFDTAFFAGLPPHAHVYPLAYEWYSDWGIRRFGFHGTSHNYCTQRTAELLGNHPGCSRLVICHLGNGCSASAVQDGVAVATTMGFTPAEGLMMGTRAGSIDPAILIYLQQRLGFTPQQLDEQLNRRSGLLGVSGVSSDFREVSAAADNGNERARLALKIYIDRVRSAIGALAVGMGGIDALVFTAGVGEHNPRFRAAVCDRLKCLGLELDAQRNFDCQPDADIATASSAARILVIRTREEWIIAEEARRCLDQARQANTLAFPNVRK